MKNDKKPKIRFKGFDDDWEQRKWVDSVDISTEMVDPTSSEYADMPHIAPGNIESFTGRILDNVKMVKEEQLISGKFRFRPDDVVYGKINPQLGKYFYASVDGLTSADAYVFKGKNGTTQKFLFSLLQTNEFFKYSVSVSKRSGMPKINRDELNAYRFFSPNEEEQDKIGDLLLGIGHLITLHQRKCDKLQKIKKSMLEKMFPQNESKKPEIRFKGFNVDWEQRKLGDSCKLNGRIGFRGYTEKDIISKEAGGVLTFSPTNIVDNKLTIECKNTYITREKYDESPEIKISNGDILFVKTGSTLGKSALVTGLKEDASINPQIVVMRVEKDTENFMSNVLITDRVMKQVAAVKIGGAVPTMTETELKNFTYFAPAEKEEKKKIGDYFRTLDHLITLHQRELEKMKYIKKSMLEKMFV